MPKAFTHLCDKVNLSLFNDTLTIYPKSKMVLPPVTDQRTMFLFILFSQMDCVSAKCGTMFDMRKNELGVYRFVHHDDADHYLYHQDDFKMDDNHYHAQFAKTIDEIKLEDILGILENHTLISPEEHKSFLKAYHEANTVPKDVAVSKKSVAEKQIKIEQASRSEKPSVPALKNKEESDGSTFAGFKRGFFYSTPVKVVQKPTESQTLGMGNGGIF